MDIVTGKVHVLPYIPGHSTTNVIKKINRHKNNASTEALSNKGQESITDYLFESSTSIRCLAYQHGETLMRIASHITNTIKSNGKIILCGDNDSSAVVQRFADELNRRFSPGNKSFPATALSCDNLGDVGKAGNLLIIEEACFLHLV